jgi:chromosome partitioning protein
LDCEGFCASLFRRFTAWRADREPPPLFPVVGFASEKLPAEVRSHALKYDHILIDAPPRNMGILRAVALSAHCLLIPVQPSKHDIRSTSDFLETVKEAIDFNPGLKVAFIINRRITGTALGRDIFTALEEYPFPVLHTVIGQRVAFPEAHASGLSVIEQNHGGQSPAVAEIEALALELLEMLNHDEKDSLGKKPPVSAEQWIQQGDKRPDPTPISGGPIVRVTFEFPQDLHRKMKGKAGAEGLTLKQVMLSFARQWVEGSINPQ